MIIDNFQNKLPFILFYVFRSPKKNSVVYFLPLYYFKYLFIYRAPSFDHIQHIELGGKFADITIDLFAGEYKTVHVSLLNSKRSRYFGIGKKKFHWKIKVKVRNSSEFYLWESRIKIEDLTLKFQYQIEFSNDGQSIKKVLLIVVELPQSLH